MAHDWSNADGICAVCGAECQHGFDIDDNGALVFEATVPATCETPAQGHIKCSICGLTDPEVIEDPEAILAAHQLSDVEANAPTCTEDGNIAYKVCDVCDKMFDAEGHELTAEDIIDPATGHDWSNKDGVCAECGTVCEHDFGDGDTCTICGKPNIAPGDANGDGAVNNKDLGLLMQKLNGWDVEIDDRVADVNGDGVVNNKDYGLLMQFVNGWDVKLG